LSFLFTDHPRKYLLSKKRRNRAKDKHRSKHHEQTADHGEGEASMVYTVKIEPRPDQEKRDADDQEYRKKQLNLLGGLISYLV